MKLSSELFQNDWMPKVRYRTIGDRLEWVGRHLVLLQQSDFAPELSRTKTQTLLHCFKVACSVPGLVLRLLASCDKPLFQMTQTSDTPLQPLDPAELKVLTLNAACLPSWITVNFNHLRPTEIRAKEIADAIRQKIDQYDVICFQELFSEEGYKIIAQQLSQHYNWSVHHAGNGYIGFNSGLCIFSKFPIEKADFQKYSPLVGEDALTDKGFMCADLHVGSQSVRVYTTHTQSGGYPKWLKNRLLLGRVNKRRQPHFEAFRRHVESARSDTVIVTGDFNLNLLDANERRLNGERFFALFRDYQPQGDGTTFKNEWLIAHQDCKLTDSEEVLPTQHRVIDGVFVTKTSAVKSVDVRIVNTFTNSSDHLGIVAKINLKKLKEFDI